MSQNTGGIAVASENVDSTFNNIMSIQISNDIQSEQVRELINSTYEDDEFLYTENEDAFLETRQTFNHLKFHTNIIMY